MLRTYKPQLLRKEDVKIIEVSSSKGGVGTTTVACCMALALANKSPERVLLLDLSSNEDCFGILGVSTTSTYEREQYEMSIKKTTRQELADTLNLGDYDFVVIDAGLETSPEYRFGPVDLRIQVVRNEYMALRAASTERGNFDATVVLFQKQYALTVGDVQMILRNTPIVFEISADVARAVDSGLIAWRENLWGDWTDSIIETHLTKGEST
jgi:hypothetical protein